MFAQDGTLLGTEPWPGSELPVGQRTRSVQDQAWLRFGQVLSRDSPVLGFLRGRTLATVDLSNYVVLRDSTDARDTLLSAPLSSSVVYRRDREDLVNGYAPFGVATQWAAAGDSLVAVLDGYRGRAVFFAIFRAGPVEVASLDLGWPERRVDNRAVGEIQRELADGRGGKPDDWVVLVPDLYGQAGAMRFDDRDRLWVQHRPDARNPSPNDRWYVVAWRTGEVFATVDLPERVHLSDVRRDRIVCVHTDELDVQTVRVYRLPPIPRG